MILNLEQAEELGLKDKAQHLLLKRLLNDNAEDILNTKQQQEEEDEDGNGKKKKQKTAYPINKYSQGIPLVEAILIDNVPYFLSLSLNEDNKKPVLYEKIELSEDMDIVPPERTEYLSKEYSFKSKEEVDNYLDLARHETLDTLFYQIKTILKKYVDMDDDFINILAADAVFTYFQDKLGMTHYLLIVGDNNTGKSNILMAFSILGYRAILDTSITAANIYNFGSQLEEGQCIILEDELGDIDEQLDKKKLYQVSYNTGKKVTRMYDNNTPGNSTGRKSTRQQGFFLYCFKMFASEKMPNKVKSKGFLERVIPLKALPGDPLYDISEIVDDSGDEEFKELNQELQDTRKLLLMYRLLHFNDKIPNLTLNVKNRYKQLTKPLVRLFQNTQSFGEITKALSTYIIEKNKEKIDSLDSAILSFIIDLIKERGTPRLFNFEIWKDLKIKYPDGKIEDKPYSCYIEGLGTVSKNRLTEICEQKFGAVKIRDEAIGRGLFFDMKILNKVYENYSIIDEICIVEDEDETNEEENE